jgi:hypothetical protein
MRSACALFVAVALTSSSAMAQVVRGTVVVAGDRPMPGVVVQLIDSAEVVLGRSLSGANGEYSIRAPRPATYRLRALRVGFRPVTSTPFTLAAGESREVRLLLDSERVELPAVRVEERSACGRQSREGAVAFAVWDQAMTSVAAAAITTAARVLTVTSLGLDRTLEPSGRIRDQSVALTTDLVDGVWTSLPAPILRDSGYVIADDAGGITFHAPGLDVVSSPTFLEDHCLRAVAGRDADEVGVAYEPTPARRHHAEITGRLWLSRSTSQLKRMEFTYLNVPGMPSQADYEAGGVMSFAHLPGGAVVISKWEIRMPRFIRISNRDTRMRTEAVIVDGGELIVVRNGPDTLYRRPPLSVTGMVRDSTSGRPIPGATVALVGTNANAVTRGDGRFTLTDLLPGEYTVAISTPSLDSISALSPGDLLVVEGMQSPTYLVPTALEMSNGICGRDLQGAAGRGRGAVFGAVTDLAGDPLGAGVRVRAEWNDVEIAPGAAPRLTNTTRVISARTDRTGSFRLCGVPMESVLSLMAMPDSGRSERVTLRLAPGQRFGSARIPVDVTRPGVAVFRGVVIADSTRAPVPDVEVVLPDLGLTTRSDARGQFRIAEIPPGTHRVVARRIGFGAMESQVTFAANDDEERQVVLSNVQQLAQVNVISTILDIEMREFAENQRTGLGRFLTREDLSRYDAMPLHTSMRKMSGIRLLSASTGGGTAPATTRNRITMQSVVSGQCEPPMTAGRGYPCACYARVYVDGVLQNPGFPSEPFDVNELMTEGVEGVEWYGNPATIPARYLDLNTTCGVLVIHRRRDGTKPLSRKERADSVKAARDSAQKRPPPKP